MSAAGEFIDSSIDRYGRQGGQDLCGAILDAVNFASGYHDLITPLRHVKLGFGSWADTDEQGIPLLPVIGLSNGYYGFGMLFNDRYPLEVLKLGAKSAAVHEVTHAAQNQHGKMNGEFSEGAEGFTFLKSVFNEGVADWHASRCQSRLYGSLYSVALHGSENAVGTSAEIATELARLSDVGCDFPTSELVDYLQGDPQCPKKGYRLGLYVVRRALSLKLLAPSELVRLTNAQVQVVCDEVASYKSVPSLVGAS